MIEIPEHIKALIFDCDGTLVDSMPLHMEAWEYSLTKFGIPFDFDFFFSRKGMKGIEIVEEYNSKFNAELDIEKLIAVKHEYFQNNSHAIKPIGIVADVAVNYHNILPMAVASGGSKKNVISSLKVTGLEKYFSTILTADDSVKPKPSPDIFLEAARLMNVEPQYCQVFEDGDLGLEAARNAGMLATDVRSFILD